MRRTILLLILGPGAFLCARAQVVPDATSQEDNFRSATWIHSTNVAGQTFSPLRDYGEVSLSWTEKGGTFHPAQHPDSRTGVSVGASGATRLGKMHLWGDFAFRNLFDAGSLYNVSLYEVPADLPYYILDDQPSRWNRQEYDMRASAALPLGRDVSLGAAVGYVTKVAAKQKDPRTEDYRMDIHLRPSVAWRVAPGHEIGLSGLVRYDFEQTKPTNANAAASPTVYMTTGLGEGKVNKVGGNDGISEYLFTTWEGAGHVQYRHTGSVEVLAEAGLVRKRITVEQEIAMPQNMGNTRGTTWEGNLQCLWGRDKADRMTVSGLFRSTDGIEYVQHRDNTSKQQRWVTDAENKMSRYDRTEVAASYDHLFGAGKPDGYDAKVGGRASFTMEDDAYFIPASSFRWSRLFAGAFAARQFRIKAVRLLAEASAGYGLSLEGAYTYGGTKVNSPAVEMYRLDSIHYGTDFAQMGAAATCTLPSRGRVRYNLGLDADCRFAVGADEAAHRTVCALRFGVSF